jgi:hypothetical protein
MNKCSYCGAQYPDDVVECPIDHTRMVEQVRPVSASPEPQHKSGILAAILFFLSLCALGAVGVLTNWWYHVVAVQPDTWGAFMFCVPAAAVAIASFALVLIPGIILYRRKRQQLFLVSLCVASLGLLALFVEFIVLYFTPLESRGPAG